MLSRVSLGRGFQSTLPVWGGTRRAGPEGPTTPFQSTLPVWGGTSVRFPLQRLSRYFNPPSPCGEGLSALGAGFHADNISIHPPRVGRDCIVYTKYTTVQRFQSTLPVWGGTRVAHHFHLNIGISIHPPRVGRDPGRVGRGASHRDFNPPSPCGEGPLCAVLADGSNVFQSTLPVWGGTLVPGPMCSPPSNFNPPSPCGEGRKARKLTHELLGFQSTLPVWGGTDPRLTVSSTCLTFQSTLPVWGGTRSLQSS